MGVSREVKDEILTEIANHLRVHGAKDWHLVRDRFPDVIGGGKGSAGERNFFRWVRLVQEGAVPTALAQAVKSARSAAGRNLPVAPPPEYIMKGGAKATRNIDFLAVLGDVADDTELLREWSSKVDDDGKRQIKNPVYFDLSIRRRMDMLQTGLSLMREVWDLELMRSFYDEVISIIADEIAPAHPEIARRVLERLKALNDKRGMTPHAGQPL